MHKQLQVASAQLHTKPIQTEIFKCLFRPYYFTSGVSSVGREVVNLLFFFFVCIAYFIQCYY